MKTFDKDPYAGRPRDFRLTELVNCANALKLTVEREVKGIREQLAAKEPLPDDIGGTRLDMARLAMNGIVEKLDEVEAAIAGVLYSLSPDFVDRAGR